MDRQGRINLTNNYFQDWCRKSQNERGEETKAPPRLDVNAPDLYIPSN